MRKNCEPPELAWPVLAIERVPGALLSFEMFSSSMLPPFMRFSVAPCSRTQAPEAAAYVMQTVTTVNVHVCMFACARLEPVMHSTHHTPHTTS